MTIFNDIIHKGETCHKGIHIHSRAKRTLGWKYNENLNRMETENKINENHRRCEICIFSIRKNYYSKHSNSILPFSNMPASKLETETEAQIEVGKNQPKSLFQSAKGELDLPKKRIGKRKNQKID